ncbi:hypothetical protein NKH77_05670 [Streptomyces sp. M19]
MPAAPRCGGRRSPLYGGGLPHRPGAARGTAAPVARLAAVVAVLLAGLALAAPVRLVCGPGGATRWSGPGRERSPRPSGSGCGSTATGAVAAARCWWSPTMSPGWTWWCWRPSTRADAGEAGGGPVAGAGAARGVGRHALHRPGADPGAAGDGRADRRSAARRPYGGGFPEGSTWCGRESGRYRPAVFQAALDAGVPVRPVTTRYVGPDGLLSTAPAYVGDDTLFASLRRVVAARGSPRRSPWAGHPARAVGDRRALARAARPGGGSPSGRTGAQGPCGAQALR